MSVEFDMSGLVAKFNKLRQVKKEVMKPTYEYFKRITPIHTGNARSNTKLQNDKVQATYTYAAVLDAGRGFRNGQMRGSIQAPIGMSIPTTKELTRLTKTYVTKHGGKG